MNKTISIAVAAAFIGTVGSAVAQDHNPAIKDSTVAHVSHAADGANSFTEDQAKGRITKAGYTQITNLKKNDDGQWVGWAMKGGKKANVALDYKGNVTVMTAHK